MNPTFDSYYRQLGRATVWMLFGTLGLFGLTLLFALLGFSHAVVSFRGATFSVAYAFTVLLIVFLASSLVAATMRWLDRRKS